MVSTHRTRQIVRAAAYGGGGLLGVGAATVGVIAAQTSHAKRTIGPRRIAAPYADRRYGRSKGPSKRLVMIGDSIACGLGADRPADTVGALLARLVADYAGQAVVLSTIAEIGARSRDLEAQATRALLYRPHVAVIIIGANDVTHAVRPQVSVRRLRVAVLRLRASGVQVVAGTCPDLGTVQPIRPPLRWLVRQQSRTLAAAQTVAVVTAGGRAVSMGDLLGPEFSARPEHLFSADRFHPSTQGYEAVAQALAPAVLAALSRGSVGEILPDLFHGAQEELTTALTAVAVSAAGAPGTEIAPLGTAGEGRGFRAIWHRSRRRGWPSGQPPADSRPEPEGTGGTVEPGYIAQLEAGMTLHHSEDTHRLLLERIPTATGKPLSEWFTVMEQGPALSRFDERVTWLRSEHELSHGQATAIVHEYDKVRAARKLA